MCVCVCGGGGGGGGLKIAVVISDIGRVYQVCNCLCKSSTASLWREISAARDGKFLFPFSSRLGMFWCHQVLRQEGDDILYISSPKNAAHSISHTVCLSSLQLIKHHQSQQCESNYYRHHLEYKMNGRIEALLCSHFHISSVDNSITKKMWKHCEVVRNVTVGLLCFGPNLETIQHANL